MSRIKRRLKLLGASNTIAGASKTKNKPLRIFSLAVISSTLQFPALGTWYRRAMTISTIAVNFR